MSGLIENLLRPVNFVMTIDAEFSESELARISEIREQVRRLLNDIFINPTRALAKLDCEKRTLESKELALVDIQKYVRAKKREQVVEGLSEQPWDLVEVDRYLAKFDLEAGLNTATDEQINRIWTDMKNGRMIGIFVKK